MQTPSDVISVAHTIQQSVAPVFLLTGVGAILAVLSTRFGRIVDRFRVLDALDETARAASRDEMARLTQRAYWSHWAISLCTICALFVCVVIAAMFIGAELNKDPSATISVLFVVAMLSLTAGLLCFLREIALASGNIKLR